MTWDNKGRYGDNDITYTRAVVAIEDGKNKCIREPSARRRCADRAPTCPPFAICGPTAPPTRMHAHIPAVRAAWGLVGVLKAGWGVCHQPPRLLYRGFWFLSPWISTTLATASSAMMCMQTLMSSPACLSQGGHPFLWRSLAVGAIRGGSRARCCGCGKLVGEGESRRSEVH